MIMAFWEVLHGSYHLHRGSGLGMCELLPQLLDTCWTGTTFKHFLEITKGVSLMFAVALSTWKTISNYLYYQTRTLRIWLGLKFCALPYHKLVLGTKHGWEGLVGSGPRTSEVTQCPRAKGPRALGDRLLQGCAVLITGEWLPIWSQNGSLSSVCV